MDCGAIPEASCDGRHSILDPTVDVEEIMGLLTDVSGTRSQAIEKRQKIDDFLQTIIANNRESLQRLRSLAEKEQLSAGKSGITAIKKKLEDVLEKTKGEEKKAEKELSGLNDFFKRNVKHLRFI